LQLLADNKRLLRRLNEEEDEVKRLKAITRNSKDDKRKDEDKKKQEEEKTKLAQEWKQLQEEV
jgi:hypothetical protein